MALVPPCTATAEVWHTEFDSDRLSSGVRAFDGGHADHEGLRSFTCNGVASNGNRLSWHRDCRGYRPLGFDLDEPVPEEPALGIAVDAGGDGTSAVSVNTSNRRKSNGGNRPDFTLPYGMQS